MFKKEHRAFFWVAVLFTILGFVIGSYLTEKRLRNILSSQVIDSGNVKVAPLGFLTGVKTSKGIVYLLVEQEHVYFHPFEDMNNAYKAIDISRELYPKLFEQGVANSNVIQASDYTDPKTKVEFIKLANMQPDHGGYASTYMLFVNPFTGETKEAPNDYSSN